MEKMPREIWAAKPRDFGDRKIMIIGTWDKEKSYADDERYINVSDLISELDKERKFPDPHDEDARIYNAAIERVKQLVEGICP